MSDEERRDRSPEDSEEISEEKSIPGSGEKPAPQEPWSDAGAEEKSADNADGSFTAPGEGEERIEVDSAEDETQQGISAEEYDGLLAELDLAQAERDEYLDDMRRMKAETENIRKRLDRERERIIEMASERIVREVLPVIDNLDRALEVEGDIREGVRAVRDQLLEALSREGLSVVASDGQPFDPNVHEAVMGQPSEEQEEDTVLATLQRGYLLNGRAIRPAKVVVVKHV